MRICVLGLGNMGLPMALNLARAGHDVTGTNIVAPVMAAEEAGVRTTTDPRVACADRELVICVLPDLPYLEPMLPDVIAGGARDLVIASTVSPVAVAALAERLRGQLNVMDASMSGGVAKAEDATMSIMCGAEPAMFDRLLPILRTVGASVSLLGPVGAGATAKACNQMVVAGTLVSLAEACIVARRNGVDVGAMLDAVGAGLGGSEVLRQKRDKLANQEFSTSGPAKFLVKDLGFAVDAGGSAYLPVLRILRELFSGLTEAGLGELDNTVVLTYLEQHA